MACVSPEFEVADPDYNGANPTRAKVFGLMEGRWNTRGTSLLVHPSISEQSPIRIVHPLARNAITGHCLRAAHDRPIISWVTGALQHIIGIYVDLNFAIPESNVVSKVRFAKYQ
ncbi:hypothetical protein QFZ65_003378 [Arthrobacter sp. B3I9]|nr:hypothetical protein [Arthrobacter sp. B3I9]